MTRPSAAPVLAFLLSMAAPAVAVAQGETAGPAPVAAAAPEPAAATAEATAAPAGSDSAPAPAAASAPAAAPAPVEEPADPLLADAGADAADPELTRQQTLTLYGFMDFGFNKFYTSDKSQLNTLFPSRAGTFVLGNANVFFDAQPYEDWRALLEIRFTNLPHGVERSLAQPAGGAYERSDTEVSDFTNPSVRGDVLLGSVILERVQTEYTPFDALKFTGGYFFTPWGIWNVDHGTPTLISLLLPSFIADGYLPAHQLGVQVSGSVYTSSWELGYHAYAGNNRTPSQVDFRNDKSFGGRLFASSTGSAVKTKLGVSGYYGHGSDIEKKIVSLIPYLAETTETVSYREAMVGVDASIDAGALRLRTEGFVRRIDFEDGKRRGFTPNHYYSDAYVLAAYQLPFAGLEPYVYGEAMHFPSALGDTALIPSIGVNVHFNPAVQLKTQWGHAFFLDLDTDEARTPGDNDVDNLTARLVVSF